MVRASEKKILVVDDEPDVRNFLAACLEDAGFTVKTAFDGVDAMEKLDDFNPDLMTLDMVMPRLSGVKVILKLRKIDKWSNLPIIVITAHAHDEMGTEEIKGFNAIVSGLRPKITMDKPISPPNLIKVISEILGVEPEVEKEPIDMQIDKGNILRQLNEADGETLKKIRALLNK